MKRIGHQRVTVGEPVNGFSIERLTIGARTYWSAVKCDEEGYSVAAYRDLPTRQAAERAARAHGAPL